MSLRENLNEQEKTTKSTKLFVCYITLCVTIKKEIIKIDKDSNKNFETIYTK